MEKSVGNVCPRCCLQALDIYYEEDSDVQLGARCEECGLKGFFMKGRLVPVTIA